MLFLCTHPCQVPVLEACQKSLKKYLKKQYVVKDLGNTKLEPKDDYPDYASKVAKSVVRNKAKGVLICGSGQGACIAANKIKGARAVSINNTKDARLTREHNDANIICLSGWNTKKGKKTLSDIGMVGIGYWEWYKGTLGQ